ncbi:MAG: hypothetical protein AB1758_36265, partial [Candidatus Eremiobacterota bacterium]
LARLVERAGMVAAMVGTFQGLAALGIPAYGIGFGTYFVGRSAWQMVSAARQGAHVLGKPGPATLADRVSLVEQSSKLAMGVACAAFGLQALGVLPHSVAWPAAFAAVGIQAGRELADLWVSRRERMEFREEAERFARLPANLKATTQPQGG